MEEEHDLFRVTHELLECRKDVIVKLWKFYLGGKLEEPMHAQPKELPRTREEFTIRIMLSHVVHEFIRTNLTVFFDRSSNPFLCAKEHDIDLIVFAEFIAAEYFSKTKKRSRVLKGLRK